MNEAVALLRRLPVRQDLCLISLIVATLAMMVLPMPTEAADILIAVSIALSVLLLITAVYLTSPADFSTLPTVILLTTIFRLSISITTSRLVLTQADAGDIIRTFGDFVISGNVVVGLVVFLIISVVQFMVITKGAERVAEVAARFALDALPGKQMSIDNDARTGAIKGDEAKRRRKALERESQLFGAMDGAMKFVKGDAIASLLIIAVNLVGGIMIGCVQRGMSLGEAGATYSLLAIGDGLIAQIPALLVSLTAGLVVTRVGADGASDLGADIVNQISSDPRVLIAAGGILLGLGLIPGFPTIVFVLLATASGVGGWMLQRSRRRRAKADEAAMQEAIGGDTRGSVVIQARLGHDLVSERGPIEKALGVLRVEMADELGITLPRIEVVEASDINAVGLCLVLNRVPLLSVPMSAGESWSAVSLPGAPKRIGPGGNEWTVIEGRSDTEQTHVLDAVDVVGLFARQTMLRAAGQLVGIQETQTLLNRVEAFYGDLIREAMRSAPLPRLAEVFRRLVGEGVSLRDMRQILEAVAEWAPREASAALLSEHVRVALRHQICHAAAGAGMTIQVLLIEDDLAAVLHSSIRQTISGDMMQPENAEAVVDLMRRKLRAVSTRELPVVVTAGELRRHLREFLVRHDMDVRVMSHPELASGFHIEVMGTIGLSEGPAPDDHVEIRTGADGSALPVSFVGRR
jgi:type III secretion protein V